MVVPGIYSMSHVKWLGHIEGKTRPHMGIHNRLVFTNKVRKDGKWVRVQARWIGLKSMISDCRASADGTGWLLLAFALVNLLVLLEVADRLTLKNDLEVAREIQNAMLPAGP